MDSTVSGFQGFRFVDTWVQVHFGLSIFQVRAVSTSLFLYIQWASVRVRSGMSWFPGFWVFFIFQYSGGFEGIWFLS